MPWVQQLHQWARQIFPPLKLGTIPCGTYLVLVSHTFCKVHILRVHSYLGLGIHILEDSRTWKEHHNGPACYLPCTQWRSHTGSGSLSSELSFLLVPSAEIATPTTMEMAHQGLQWLTCLINIDDIIIFGKDFSEHITRVEQVLERMRLAGLKLKPSKCEMLQTEVGFLGHVISGAGVKPSPTLEKSSYSCLST